MSEQGVRQLQWSGNDDRLRLLCELTSDFVYAVDIDDQGRWRSEWLSESFQRVFGLELDEMRRLGWRHVIHPDDHALAARRMETLLAGQVFEGELRVFDRHRAIRWLADRAQPVIDPASGRVRQILGVTQDVTERHRAARSLRESEEKYRQLVEFSPLPILVHCEHRIVFLNREAALVLGGDDPAEFIERPLWDGLHPDDWPSTERRVADIYSKRRAALPGEVRFLRPDGSHLDVQLVTSTVDYLGKPAAQVVFRDITEQTRLSQERRELETRTLHAQKLESLGALAAGIAHDFNNILVGVLGHTDLALEFLAPGDPVAGHLDEIGRGAQHAADLAQQLLDYSGTARYKTGALDLSALIAEMSRLLEVSVKKRAAIAFALTPGLPPIEADPTQLKQVLMNLVVNAADALADGGGHIAVRTGQLDAPRPEQFTESFLAPEMAGTYLEVQDNGCGMDPATVARIFDPFYTTKRTGRGLGMATVLGIVRGHQGAVDVRSVPGEGTTIRVVFPASVAVAV
jgi:two-component system cell cycle sensor histidine kinase/response regulator CckA